LSDSLLKGGTAVPPFCIPLTGRGLALLPVDLALETGQALRERHIPEVFLNDL